jgi:hypothetical protein
METCLALTVNSNLPEGLPGKRRWQFRLRTIFLAIAGVAVLLLVDRNLPGAAGMFILWLAFVAAFWTLAGLVSVPIWLVSMPRRDETRLARLARAARTQLQVLWGKTPHWMGTMSLLCMAIVYSSLLALTWRFWKRVGLEVATSTSSEIEPPLAWDWHACFQDIFGSGRYPFWLPIWPAWAQARWWLLFGLLAVTVEVCDRVRHTAEPRGTLAKRFLAFVPWFAVLELGYLCGVWVDDNFVVPEMSTIWGYGLDQPFEPLTRRLWLVRGVLPTLVVALVFFRRVARAGWTWAILFSIALVPVALVLSAAWNQLFIDFEMYRVYELLGY